MRFTRLARAAFLTVTLVALALAATGWLTDRNGPMPWSPLDLREPIGPFTGVKLARLGTDLPRCAALLRQAGIRTVRLPARSDGPNCGYADGLRLADAADGVASYRPIVAASCRTIATLALWERAVVQPAAVRRFGRRIARIDTFGTYNCRRIGAGTTGDWSEHARANAIDIAGFRLTDGRRVTVAADWTGDEAGARFLHDVRDGACRLFATVLSPEFNAAHRDHLHLDEADRGDFGWRACR